MQLLQCQLYEVYLFLLIIYSIVYFKYIIIYIHYLLAAGGARFAASLQPSYGLLQITAAKLDTERKRRKPFYIIDPFLEKDKSFLHKCMLLCTQEASVDRNVARSSHQYLILCRHYILVSRR